MATTAIATAITELDRLAQGHLGLHLEPTQLAHFGRYATALMAASEHFNLTSITAPGDVAVKHFLDSLTCLPLLKDLPPGAHIIDVGSGAGFPGIPLKIARPDVQITLLEATGKKVTFMADVCHSLKLEGIRAVHGRAEEIGMDGRHRERYDAVLARSVAWMPVLAEYLLPLSRLGGLCLVMKGPTLPRELEEAAPALKELGGVVERIERFSLPGLEDEHLIAVVRKVHPTPRAYPRRAGVPRKQPLGIPPRR